MAEQEDKKEEGEKGTEGAAAPAKGKGKLFIIIGGVVALILAIGVPVFLMSSKGKQEKNAEELESDAASKEKSLILEGHGEEEELLEGEEPLGAMYPLDTFVVNLAGGKYIRLGIQLEFESRDIPARFYSRQVLIRDSIITLLSTKAQADFETVKHKEQFKSEIKDLINEILKKEETKKVYFTQFLIQ